MRIDIKDNFPEVQRYVENGGKQATFAAAAALTLTARDDVRPALVAQLKKDIDRPTPYTLNSLFVKPATKAKLEAEVYIKDDRATTKAGTPATKFLLPQIDGGARGIKRFERALQLTGHMPPNTFAVPGRAARIDAFGNVSKGQIIQILSQLRVQLVSGSDRSISRDSKKKALAQRRAGGQYFSLPKGRGKLPPGIYQARDFAFGRAAPRAIFLFVQHASYRRRFKFFDVGQRVALDRFPRRFEVEFAKALRSAR